MFFFFFKQKTAYEMRISDWSSDVCSSDLRMIFHRTNQKHAHLTATTRTIQMISPRPLLSTTPHRFIPHFPPSNPPNKLMTTKYPEAFWGHTERSEERSVGQEGVSTGRCRWAPYPKKKKKQKKQNEQ